MRDNFNAISVSQASLIGNCIYAINARLQKHKPFKDANNRGHDGNTQLK